MSSPNRAPRRQAASMSLNVASGNAQAGSNSYHPQRKTASVGDGGSARASVRQSANYGPGGVDVNVDKSPQQY